MTKFPEGAIIVHKDGARRKILGVCGEVRFAQALECVGVGTYTVEELECDGYTEEAKPWEPKLKETYWFVDSSGRKCNTSWCMDWVDRHRFSFGNCFKSEGALEAARERVKKALSE